MEAPFAFGPSASGVLLAAASVMSGAPLFAAGLRARRLSRALESLRERPVDGRESGPVCLRGKVMLDGPLFAPLSQRPCAAYVLEVEGVGTRLGGQVQVVRPFRVEGESGAVGVDAPDAQLDLPRTAERTFERTVPGTLLATLIEEHAELAWVKRRTGSLRVVERALEPGASVCVAGVARLTWSDTAEVAEEWLATGTDGPVEVAPAASGPVVRIDAGDCFERVWIGERAPSFERLQPPLWRRAGLVVGPLLTLGGLLALLRAIEHGFGGGA